MAEINVLKFASGRQKPEQKGQSSEIESFTAADLAKEQFEPVRWVIPGILPEGVTLLAGAPKTGKSFLMMNWCAAVASGGSVFGQVPVDPAHVFYLALEDNRRRLQSRMNAVTGGDVPNFLHLSTTAPRIDTGLVPSLCGWLDKHRGTRLVVVDTLARIRPPFAKDASLYDQDYRIGSALLKIAADYRCAIVCVHHTNKGAKGDKLEMVSGSNGLSGGFDNVFVMAREEGERAASLFVTGRDIENEQTIGLRWDTLSSCWVLDASAIPPDASDKRILFRALRRLGKPVHSLVAMEESGLDQQRLVKAGAALVADGVLDLSSGLMSLAMPV